MKPAGEATAHDGGSEMIYLLAIILIGIDQWTKYLAYTKLRPIGTFGLIDGLIGLRYTENRGAAFSILQGQQIFLVAVSAIVSLFLIYLILRAKRRKLPVAVRFAYGVLLAGAVGNLIDRLMRGYVVDFLEFQWISFPVFNVADMYVTGAAVLIGALLLLFKAELY